MIQNQTILVLTAMVLGFPHFRKPPNMSRAQPSHSAKPVPKKVPLLVLVLFLLGSSGIRGSSTVSFGYGSIPMKIPAI